MLYTNSFVNSVYANHIDLIDLYNKPSVFSNPVIKTLEKACKYTVFTTGNFALALSLSITPIAVAIDTVCTLGIFFKKVAQGRIHVIHFFNYCLIPFSSSKMAYDTYVRLCNNPNYLHHAFANSNLLFVFGMTGLSTIMMLVSADPQFFNNFPDSLLKISKIATGVLCPPLVS